MLNAIDSGDPKAGEELLPLVYDELRRLAASKMAGEAPGQTLQPTALVHEAWLRLVDERHEWRNRKHFFCVAAEAMRRILVDRARRRNRIKHGGQAERVLIEELDLATDADSDHLLRVHEALDQLAVEHPLKAELVKLRYFVGLRIPEAAELLGISPSSAKRHWNYARAWLLDALRSSG
jgi:RNA polymerase sigma factor (TIGR02999 family)